MNCIICCVATATNVLSVVIFYSLSATTLQLPPILLYLPSPNVKIKMIIHNKTSKVANKQGSVSCQLSPSTNFHNVLRLVQCTQRINRIIIYRFINRQQNKQNTTSVTVLKHSLGMTKSL